MPPQPTGRADADSSSIVHHSCYSDFVIVKVEGTFTVHKYRLLKSEVFSDMFSTAQGDVTEGSSPNNPITLDGVTAADFESPLNVLYAPDPRITSQEAVQDPDYFSVFRLAHKWNFEDLESNILPLVETQLSDIDNILFARQARSPSLNDHADERGHVQDQPTAAGATTAVGNDLPTPATSGEAALPCTTAATLTVAAPGPLQETADTSGRTVARSIHLPRTVGGTVDTTATATGHALAPQTDSFDTSATRTGTEADARRTPMDTPPIIDTTRAPAHQTPDITKPGADADAATHTAIVTTTAHVTTTTLESTERGLTPGKRASASSAAQARIAQVSILLHVSYTSPCHLWASFLSNIHGLLRRRRLPNLHHSCLRAHMPRLHAYKPHAFGPIPSGFHAYRPFALGPIILHAIRPPHLMPSGHLSSPSWIIVSFLAVQTPFSHVGRLIHFRILFTHGIIPTECEDFYENARGTLHRPDLAPGRLVDGLRVIIPPAIIEVMSKGWTAYISLVLLHNDFLQSPEAARYARIALGLASGSKSADQLPDAGPGGAKFKHESQLSFEEWLVAWDNLIGLIRKFMPCKTLQAWMRHWRIVYTHPDRHKHWPRVLLYCIRVRKAATVENFDPGVFQELIYKEIEREELDRIAHGTSSARYQSSLIVNPKPPTATSSRSFRDPSTSMPDKKGKSADKAPDFKGRNRRMEDRSLSNLSAGTGESTVKVSATPSTSQEVVKTLPPANMAPISAPSAVPLPTAHNRAPFNPRRVSTLLIPDMWESEIREFGLQDEFGDVPSGLRDGFRIGAKHPVYITRTPPNHKSAIERPLIIEKHIQTELAAGRYFGPFTRVDLEHLIGPFQTAPLGVVEKPSAPGSFRIIQDFSFNPNPSSPTSLNSQIDTDDFPCVWGFFDEVFRVIASAPKGTLAATFDVDSAYRQIPVHPDDQPHIVFMWGDDFYIDTRVPFRAASSNGLFARCGDLIMILYTKRGFGVVIKWVDDFLFIQFPFLPPQPPFFTAPFSEQEVYDYGHMLGWQWKPSKTHPYAPVFKYLGLQWDIPGRKVRIPCDKRQKYLARTESWLNLPSVNLKDTEVLVIPEGRPHLAGLIRFLAAFNAAGRSQFSTRPPSPAAAADAKWWQAQLSTPHDGLSIRSPPPPSPVRVFTDASTSYGLGVVIDNEFASWQLTPSRWKQDSRDIGWAEAVAVELAIVWLINRGVRDVSVVIHCDNQGVVFGWQAGRSRNPQQNVVFMRIAAQIAEAGISLSLRYIPSKENPADMPSRNECPPNCLRATDVPHIPDYLSMFFV
ncbi:The BTB (BR-C, ttk and bab)/POZ (Pox virus and Zinc finger) domain [Ceratobasidium sp. AG-Ba]|nr:The BTB (BR-C, ttk and bab)/POZ (Pox virus and Zinc finger) domain [Ceratobasidium sp. AG-Ba]